MNSQFKKGALELCVLSQLSFRDQYGYELTDCISQEMQTAAGTLYLILKRLREEAYVETYLVEGGEGPARKYYHLTDKGREYQSQLAQEWETFTQAVRRLIQPSAQETTETARMAAEKAQSEENVKRLKEEQRRAEEEQKQARQRALKEQQRAQEEWKKAQEELRRTQEQLQKMQDRMQEMLDGQQRALQKRTMFGWEKGNKGKSGSEKGSDDTANQKGARK